MARYILFLWILLTTVRIQAQVPEQDCIHAIKICGTTYVQPTVYLGPGNINELNSNNQGCLLAGERDDVWYTITFTSSGMFGMTLSPINIADDYDFAVWDITDSGCAAIFNYNTLTPKFKLPVACNFSLVPGATGMSAINTGSPWIPMISVAQGTVLAINVSGYALTAGYTLFFSETTAGMTDTTKPRILAVTNDCRIGTADINVALSKTVRCSSVSSNGSQFYLSNTSAQVVSAAGMGCSSISDTTRLIRLILSTSPAAGSYWLHVSDTALTKLRDLCGNHVSASVDSFQFTYCPPVAPAITLVDTPACRFATLHFNKPIRCDSVALNGSDFVVSGPSSVTIDSAATIGCNANMLAETIVLHFSQMITTPGTYTISTQIGSDGNSIIDSCGNASSNAVAGFVISPNQCAPNNVKQVDAHSRKISVFPSPSKGRFTVNTGEQGVFFLYDATGRLIGHQAIKAKITELNFPQLAPGIYLCRFVNEDRQSSAVAIIVE